jgi:hypothetical protein
MREDSVCEACQHRPVAEFIGDDDPDEPYRVCGECGELLRRLALRPLEWFNLAAIHGWRKFLLHDDFYDQDGTADQPKTESYSADGLLAPSIDQASRSLQRLVDYCITRWWLGPPEYEAFKTFAGEAILNELARRAEGGNRHVLAVMFQLCANVPGSTAAPWVRAQYARAQADDALFNWAEAAASCLPPPEGLDMTIDALRAFQGRELRECKGALLWFRAPAVLDWIELNAPRANVTDDWGQLAALSDLSWSKVQNWLSRGRPLSFIALDALGNFIPHAGQAPIVDRLKPQLKECLDRSAIMPALEVCMAADGAPRVAARCRYVIEHLDELRIA